MYQSLSTYFNGYRYHVLFDKRMLDAAVSHKRLTDQLDSAEAMLFALARMVQAKDGNTGDLYSRVSHNGALDWEHRPNQ